MKPQLLNEVVGLLEGSGFEVSDCRGSRSCFDVLARRGKLLLVIKVLNNIEGLNRNTIHELRKVSALTGGVPIVVGDRLKSSRLADGVLYERYGIHAMSLETMGEVLSDSKPMAYSIRGNYCVHINSQVLRSLRARMDLTQDELARELGVSKQSVYRYESTGRVIFEVMERMMRVFEDDGRLVVRGELFKPELPGEDQSFNMHVPCMKKAVAEKLSDMGFSTSITNAPFDVVAREDKVVYAVVSNDNRRLEHKIELVDGIRSIVGGYGMCVTCRHVSSRRGVPVLRPEELDGFDSPDELFDRISD